MTTPNEPLVGIQARIEELHNTITEKEEQIKARTRTLKEELKAEISPDNLIRQHPFKAAGASFLAGLLLSRALGGGRKSAHTTELPVSLSSTSCSPNRTTAFSIIGVELLRSVKDLGFTYLQRYLEKKMR